MTRLALLAIVLGAVYLAYCAWGVYGMCRWSGERA
jgi:hypothetical protein